MIYYRNCSCCDNSDGKEEVEEDGVDELVAFGENKSGVISIVKNSLTKIGSVLSMCSAST
jgi:hypothetical protein